MYSSRPPTLLPSCCSSLSSSSSLFAAAAAAAASAAVPTASPPLAPPALAPASPSSSPALSPPLVLAVLPACPGRKALTWYVWQEVDGTVTRITNFGAFLNVGCEVVHDILSVPGHEISTPLQVDAFLHATQLPKHKVSATSMCVLSLTCC